MDTADLYLRLSLDFEGATAIERQEDDCRRWCVAHNLTVRRIHVDRGVSGYNNAIQRDGFDAALAAVVDGRTSTLVVWKLDRLSRRGVGQVGQLLDAFERVGGRLVSVQDQLDTAQPQARMIIALLAEFARAESETMGVRIKNAKAAQRAQGLWLSGKPPIGYAIAPDKRLAPAEPAASAIREVFAMLASGKTLVQACAYLNSLGITSSRGNRWTDSSLSSALKTSAYAGLQPERHVNEHGRHASGKPAVYRDRDTGREVSCLTPGAEPIVPRALQLDAFAAMEGRMRRFGPYARPGRRCLSLLVRGLGRCNACGRRVTNYGDGYRCHAYARDGSLACRAPVSATIRAVDAVVSDAWVQLVVERSAETESLRHAVAMAWGPAPSRPSRWRRLHAELVDLRTRLADADAAHYIRQQLDADRHSAVCEELTARIAKLEHALSRTDLKIKTTFLDDAEVVRARFDAEPTEAKRRMLRLAWTEVRITKAVTRGGQFDRRRVSYIRNPKPEGDLTWLPIHRRTSQVPSDDLETGEPDARR